IALLWAIASSNRAAACTSAHSFALFGRRGGFSRSIEGRFIRGSGFYSSRPNEAGERSKKHHKNHKMDSKSTNH
ncbi:MAG: hypothetical protein J2P31_09755, partial [Blastocatellia bacterium]|nr:hypothetical protein [Blastocatellia bacterium]